MQYSVVLKITYRYQQVLKQRSMSRLPPANLMCEILSENKLYG
jgi:hypothetical protein